MIDNILRTIPTVSIMYAPFIAIGAWRAHDLRKEYRGVSGTKPSWLHWIIYWVIFIISTPTVFGGTLYASSLLFTPILNRIFDNSTVITEAFLKLVAPIALVLVLLLPRYIATKAFKYAVVKNKETTMKDSNEQLED